MVLKHDPSCIDIDRNCSVLDCSNLILPFTIPQVCWIIAFDSWQATIMISLRPLSDDNPRHTSLTLTSCDWFTRHTYHRWPQAPEVPLTSIRASSLNLTLDHDLPIAQHKGIRSCVGRPLDHFVSYTSNIRSWYLTSYFVSNTKLSPCFFALFHLFHL